MCKKLSLLSIAVPSVVLAENLFDQIGWKGATSAIIFWLVIAIIVVIVLLTGLYIRSQFKLKKTEKDISEKTFNDMIVQADLYPLEQQKLLELLHHQFIPYRHSIFQSAALFERCIDAEVKTLLLTAKTKEEVDENEQILSNIRKKIGFGYLPLEHPLLSSRNIEIGQIMSVFPLEGKAPLISRGIVTVNKETFFRISYKADANQRIVLHSGQEINLAFARQGDAVYGLKTEIVFIGKEFYFDCSHSLEFKRNQLRQFVRMEVNLPLRAKKIGAEQQSGSEPFSRHRDVKLSDISGGGLSFFTKEPFETGDRLVMNFTLTTGKFSGIAGKVLRISDVEIKEEKMFRHHVQFINIEQHQRDKIIRFIFEKQRMQNQIR